jgi:hypothetical protein
MRIGKQDRGRRKRNTYLATRRRLNWRAEIRGKPTKEIYCQDVKDKGGSALDSKNAAGYCIVCSCSRYVVYRLLVKSNRNKGPVVFHDFRCSQVQYPLAFIRLRLSGVQPRRRPVGTFFSKVGFFAPQVNQSLRDQGQFVAYHLHEVSYNGYLH